jgi:REP element-mobilizing transposase RayT
MGNRKVPLITGEYYHVYLRGVEKRKIFLDDADVERFLLSLEIFNSADPIGSIYEHSYRKENHLGSLTSKVVDIIAYNALPNHYHILLRQCTEGGISKYMQSLNGGYTKYFNHKYNRIGSLFQGVFGSTHIQNNEQLLYTSVYVNLNHITHKIKLGSLTSKWGERSSWEQYINHGSYKYVVPCNTKDILSFYSDEREYKKEAEDIAKIIAMETAEGVEESKILQKNLEVSLPNNWV